MLIFVQTSVSPSARDTLSAPSNVFTCPLRPPNPCLCHSLSLRSVPICFFSLPDINVNLWLQAGSSCTLALFWCQSGSKSYTEDEWKPKHCHNILTSCKVNYHKFDSHIRFQFQQKENQITFKIQDSRSLQRPLGNFTISLCGNTFFLFFFLFKFTLFSFKKIMILPSFVSWIEFKSALLRCCHSKLSIYMVIRHREASLSWLCYYSDH